MACLDDASSGSSHRRVRAAARAAYRLFSASRSWLTAKRADTMITTGVPIAETRSVHLTPVVVTWTTSNGHHARKPKPTATVARSNRCQDRSDLSILEA